MRMINGIERKALRISPRLFETSGFGQRPEGLVATRRQAKPPPMNVPRIIEMPTIMRVSRKELITNWIMSPLLF
jgi:hypothetical protein